MRAFITGVAGFAGTHLAEHLLASGDAVSGTSLHGGWGTPEIQRHYPAVLQQIPVYAWDITQAPSADLQRAVAADLPEVIYHLAAASKPSQCDTEEGMRVNVAGTEQVLALASSLPQLPRVVFISSSYVYEDRPDDPQRPPVAESEPVLPSSAYGRSKVLGEEALVRYIQSGGSGVILRAFQHAGPRQSPRFMLAEWCEQFARRDGPAVKIHSAESWLDLSDVRDVVRAYRLAAAQAPSGAIYNVGSGQRYRSGDIFEQLRQLADPERPFEVISHSARSKPVADIRKLKRELGWRPEITLEQTLRDTYAWFELLAGQQ